MLGPDGGQSPGERRVCLDWCGGVQGDFFTDHDNPGLDFDSALLGRIDHGGPWSPQPPASPGLVADACDGSPRLRHRSAECVGILIGEGDGDGVLLLKQHAVETTAGGAVQFNSNLQQRVDGPGQVREVDEFAKSRSAATERLEDVDVSQASMRLFEVRLEEECHVTFLSVPLGHLLLECRKEFGAQARFPQTSYLLNDRVRQLVIAPDDSSIEQPEGDPKVGLRDLQHLLGPPYGVIDLDPLIPQGIPERVSHLFDVPPVVVDEEQVEVGVRTQFATAVAPHCHEGELARGPTRSSSCVLGETGVGDVRECPAKLRTPKGGPLEEEISLRAKSAERHEGTVALASPPSIRGVDHGRRHRQGVTGHRAGIDDRHWHLRSSGDPVVLRMAGWHGVVGDQDRGAGRHLGDACAVGLPSIDSMR